MKKILISTVALACSTFVFAQQENLSNSTKPVHLTEAPLDGYTVKSDIENRKIVPYAPVRQTDVAFSKRVWRELDLRVKLNQAFASPKSRLIDVIVAAVQNGELTAYDPTPAQNDPNGDSFKNILTVDQVMARLGGDSVLVEQFNENNEVISSKYENRSFDGASVIKFRIKEDWIFDKQRSVFEPRIIGIAPLIVPQVGGNAVAQIDAAGTGDGVDPFDPFAVKPENESLSEEAPLQNQLMTEPVLGVDPTPAFWIYFPEARQILANKEVMNRHNDATGLSYDDVFIKRLFASYVVKQSNTEDLRIKDYIRDDMDRLFESERIKKVLVDYEQDLWSY